MISVINNFLMYLVRPRGEQAVTRVAINGFGRIGRNFYGAGQDEPTATSKLLGLMIHPIPVPMPIY